MSIKKLIQYIELAEEEANELSIDKKEDILLSLQKARMDAKKKNKKRDSSYDEDNTLYIKLNNKDIWKSEGLHGDDIHDVIHKECGYDKIKDIYFPRNGRSWCFVNFENNQCMQDCLKLASIFSKDYGLIVEPQKVKKLKK